MKCYEVIYEVIYVVISSTVYLKENESLVVMLSQLLQHSVLNHQKQVRYMSPKKSRKKMSGVELEILDSFVSIKISLCFIMALLIERRALWIYYRPLVQRKYL